MRKYDMVYIHCGKFVGGNNYIHPTRIIDSYELFYITAGSMYFKEGDNKYVLNAGDLFLASPNIIHGGYKYNFGETSFYWLHFITENLDKLGVKRGHTPNCSDFRFLTLFKQLLHIANTEDYPKYAVTAALESIIGELKYAQTTIERGGISLAHEISEWIRINSKRKLTIQDVGEAFSYNPDHLSKLMKKSMGKTLKQFIDYERLKCVKNLILSTDMTMGQIAECLGWENDNQFIHYFQYHEKIGPKKFRDLYFRTHLNNK
ncbi:MAG TPA: AraC family transcriptional regulator [Clostridia bacterium]|nr:AraC family transcriptional regulator [Clostridia bacterium]